MFAITLIPITLHNTGVVQQGDIEIRLNLMLPFFICFHIFKPLVLIAATNEKSCVLHMSWTQLKINKKLLILLLHAKYIMVHTSSIKENLEANVASQGMSFESMQ